MEANYDVLIMTTERDFLRLKSNYHRLVKNMPAKRLIFVGSEEVGNRVQQLNLGEQVGFINENDILPFADVHKVMQNALQTENVPRGVTGWYYQQFLKMQYSFFCEDDYYLVWDGDTIPCKPFKMFQEDGDKPFFDLKREYHEEYFVTLGKLFPGMKKCIQPSFISEHMIIKKEIMQSLIADIMKNGRLSGNSFYERIINCIEVSKLTSNSFSEFETYGTYTCFKYLNSYRLRNWHSFRYAGHFFHPEEIMDSDYEWLGRDFDAVSFEKDHTVREDHKNLFTRKDYQEKLSARQMLEIAQKEFTEGYLEVWEDTLQETDADKEAKVYERLGDAYLSRNKHQAYLCYENAEFLCTNKELKKKLAEKKEELAESGEIAVNKVSFVIVSYNCKYMMEQCLASIRKYCNPQTYQIVVVDNASTDGIREWLREQQDVKLIENEQNLGFPKGCNVGISASDKGNDIFLLNNDTRMAPNALFWLRMGLYENEQVGAAGCVANYCGNDQQIDVEFTLPNEYLEYGRTVNVYRDNPYEERNRLCGFAMLIRRHVLDKVGCMDENFSPGYYEDDDLSIRIQETGHRLIVCHNSFIYHAGSQSFYKRDDLAEIMQRNYRCIKDKWQFDIPMNSLTNAEVIESLCNQHAEDEEITVLEIGAGCGNTLSRLKYLFPKARLYGIEQDELAVKYAVKNVEIMAGDWKTMELPFAENYFDYVIYSNRWEEPIEEELLIDRLAKYVKENGKLMIETKDTESEEAYELYYMQGQTQETQQNYRAAYLCYLQGMLYAEGENRQLLEGIVKRFQKQYPEYCQKIVILLSAGESLERLAVCLNSIRKFSNRLLCDVICLVQNQQAELKEWLMQQADIEVREITSTENYASVRNDIIRTYKQEDILLLNANCALMPDTIHNLAMTLAEQDKVGIVAARDCQNAENENVYLSGTEEKCICFDEAGVVLIRRDCLQETLLDEHIMTEKYAIIDLALSSLSQDYENRINTHSFIQRMAQDVVEDAKAQADAEYLAKKWGIDIEYYNTARTDLISLMKEDRNKAIRVLEIGCGTGATLMQIRKLFPNAQVYGLELQEKAAQLGSKLLPIVCGNVEDRTLDFPNESFDYILFGDVLEHLVNPEDTLVYLKKFLKNDGYILASIPNILHYSAFIPLLFGEFEYFDAGILDRTHLRFFTLRSIRNMFERIDCEIVEMRQNVDNSLMEPWIEQIIDKLCAISSEIDRQGFLAWQYCVKVQKKLIKEQGINEHV